MAADATNDDTHDQLSDILGTFSITSRSIRQGVALHPNFPARIADFSAISGAAAARSPWPRTARMILTRQGSGRSVRTM